MRIAHLTDLHWRQALPGSSQIVARRSRRMPEVLAAALADARARGAEFLALTGDLLDVPSYLLRGDDYYDYQADLWERDAEADCRAVKEMLDGTGLPYQVLPGNHDWERPFWRVFPREPHVLEQGGFRFVRFCDREHEAHLPRRFDRERVLFLSQLADSNSPLQVHLQHYVITPALNEGYPHTYLEGEELRTKTVASGRVRLSLSGHYHPGTELMAHGACAFTAGPALAEFPHRYRLYDLTPDGVTMQEVALREQPCEAGRPVVFLDRDGVLNPQPFYRTGPEEMVLLPGGGAALRRLREAGYALVVISSQSAIGAGYVSDETVGAVMDRLCRLVQAEGAELDAIYYSRGAGERAVHPSLVPHEDSKPRPYYLFRAQEELGVDLSRAFLIGDSRSDLEAALAAEVTPILVRTGHGRITETQLAGLPPVAVVDDLPAAVELVVRRNC